jgi:hypothetical protein
MTDACLLINLFNVTLRQEQADLFIVQPVRATASASSKKQRTELINGRNNPLYDNTFRLFPSLLPV